MVTAFLKIAGFLDRFTRKVLQSSECNIEQTVKALVDGTLVSVGNEGRWEFKPEFSMTVSAQACQWSPWYFSIKVLTNNQPSAPLVPAIPILEGVSYLWKPQYVRSAGFGLVFASPWERKNQRQKIIRDFLIRADVSLSSKCQPKCMSIEMLYQNGPESTQIQTLKSGALMRGKAQLPLPTYTVNKVIEFKISMKMPFDFTCYANKFFLSGCEITFKIAGNEISKKPISSEHRVCSVSDSHLLNGRCVRFVRPKYPISWEEAEQHCESEKGHLLDMKDQSIKTLTRHLSYKTSYISPASIISRVDLVYIGAKRSRDTWYWHGNIPMTFADWSPGAALSSTPINNAHIPVDAEPVRFDCMYPVMPDLFGVKILGNDNRTLCTAVMHIALPKPNFMPIDCDQPCTASYLCQYPPIRDEVPLTEGTKDNVGKSLGHSCERESVYINGQCYFILPYIHSDTTKSVCVSREGGPGRIASLTLLSNTVRVFWLDLFKELYQTDCFVESHLGTIQLWLQGRTHLRRGKWVVEDINSDQCAGKKMAVCFIAPNITSPSCPKGTYTCDQGTCISEAGLCDGHSDCPGGDDEVACPQPCKGSTDCSMCTQPECQCSQGMYQCEEGGCLPPVKVCDGITDCGSDEQNCTHADGYLSSDYVERHRTRRIFALKELRKAVCNTTESNAYQTFDCKVVSSKYQCFTLSNLCHYRSEPREELQPCTNGMHLRQCDQFECPGYYKCPSSYCISLLKVCDGIPHCQEAEDESGCDTFKCAKGFFKCPKETLCLRASQVSLFYLFIYCHLYSSLSIVQCSNAQYRL